MRRQRRFEDGINRLAAAGLTRGCGDRRLLPRPGPCARGGFAAALAIALRCQPPADYFSDDEGSPTRAPSTASPPPASPPAARTAASAPTASSAARSWPPSSIARWPPESEYRPAVPPSAHPRAERSGHGFACRPAIWFGGIYSFFLNRSFPVPLRNRRFAAVLASAALAITVSSAAAQPVAAVDGSGLVTIANRYRANAGVPPVRLQSADRPHRRRAGQPTGGGAHARPRLRLPHSAPGRRECLLAAAGRDRRVEYRLRLAAARAVHAAVVQLRRASRDHARGVATPTPGGAGRPAATGAATGSWSS